MDNSDYRGSDARKKVSSFAIKWFTGNWKWLFGILMEELKPVFLQKCDKKNWVDSKLMTFLNFSVQQDCDPKIKKRFWTRMLVIKREVFVWDRHERNHICIYGQIWVWNSKKTIWISYPGSFGPSRFWCKEINRQSFNRTFHQKSEAFEKKRFRRNQASKFWLDEVFENRNFS